MIGNNFIVKDGDYIPIQGLKVNDNQYVEQQYRISWWKEDYENNVFALIIVNGKPYAVKYTP